MAVTTAITATPSQSRRLRPAARAPLMANTATPRSSRTWRMLALLPRLGRNRRRRGQGLQVRHQHPDGVGREDPAERRHAARPPIEDRLEDLVVGPAVAPAPVGQAGPDPARGAAAVAAVAVHRDEQSASGVHRLLVTLVGIRELRAGRLAAA